MKKIDRVRPVKRYRAAKYPSHADPDPTTYPAPVPFPFHRELVRAVAGVGLAATLGFASQQAPPSSPFTLEKSGLPHRTSPYGTGQPSYLSDELARGVIDKVFKESGFALQRDALYARDGVSFRAGGYDPERRVGYVFANWKTVDDDAILSWTMPETPPEPKRPAEIRYWLKTAEYALKTMPEALQKQAAEVAAMPDGDAMVEAYKKLRTAYRAERVSLQEMKTLEDRALKEKEFIAVVSQFDPRHHVKYDSSGPALVKFAKEIEAEKDPAKKTELRRRYMEEQARGTLETLERNVREFLAWARANGLR